MRLSTAVAVALTVLLATSTVGAVAASPSASADTSDAAPTLADQSPPASASAGHAAPLSSDTAFPTQDATAPPSSPDPQQVLRIEIDDDGDAHWTIESRFVLTDDEAVDDFLAFADAVAAGERDVAFDRQLLEYWAQQAADRTDRAMSIENAGWDDPRVHSIDDDDVVDADAIEVEDAEDARIGIVSYSFTWTNFATVENDRIHVGDAFRTDDGVWLSLADSQRLVIEPPAEYALETPTQLEWNGPYEFDDGELDIVFVHTPRGLEMVSWLFSAGSGFVVAVGVIAVVAYLLARRNEETDVPSPAGRLPGRVVALGETVRSRVFLPGSDAESPTATDTDGGTVASSSGTGTDAAGTGPAADGTQLEFEEPADDVDPELLSDEERVLRLLKRNGGRMKQGSIVSETGWSNAKVSQLLSQMDDDGDIDKLRIGRENLITLPGVDPTEVN